MQPEPQPLIILTGPTAVGKSALALELADRLNAEIVSADSRQVYHYMDIGTAKPTVQERAAVPHHLIDVVYPDEPFSIATYQALGERILADIQARGRRVLLVGGSAHYVQALVDRLQPAPHHVGLRAWLERVDREAGPGALNRWLIRLDPASARAIEPRNRRRVLRALEVTLLTGRPFSRSGRARAPMRPALWFGLRLERAGPSGLHARVEQRIRDMLAAGWLDEVRTLLAMGYAPTLPALSATGYSELVQVARGHLDLEEAVLRIRRATHSFIRRQDAWLRAEPRLEWLDASDPAAALSRIVAVCTAGPA